MLVSFVAGAAVVSGAWSLIPTPRPQPSVTTPSKDGHDEEDALRKANANLTSSLQECDRKMADQVATEAMRQTMDTVPMRGTIVIGEGERDEAPMLYIGEQVGA